MLKNKSPAFTGGLWLSTTKKSAVDDEMVKKLLELADHADTADNAKTEFSLKSVAGMLYRDSANDNNLVDPCDILDAEDGPNVHRMLPMAAAVTTPCLSSGPTFTSTASHSTVTAVSCLPHNMDSSINTPSSDVEFLPHISMPTSSFTDHSLCFPAEPSLSGAAREWSGTTGQNDGSELTREVNESPTVTLAEALKNTHISLTCSWTGLPSVWPSYSCTSPPSQSSISSSNPVVHSNDGRRSQQIIHSQGSNKSLTTTAEAVGRIYTLLTAQCKVLVLMRGCPGSGKTTMAMQIVFNGVVLSTDDYFVNCQGVYQHDSRWLQQAHMWNQQRAQCAMLQGCNPVIIDNTNTQAWQMLAYVRLARKYNYVVEICEPSTPWQWKASQLAKCNIHGVSGKKIKRMLETYEHNITVQSLLAMLPPQHTRTTPSSSTNDSADSQSQASAADDDDSLCCLKSSLSCTAVHVTSVGDCLIQSSSVPALVTSQCCVSSCDAVGSRSGITGSSCLVSEATSKNEVASCDWMTPSASQFVNSSKSVCCETLGTECSTSHCVENFCTVSVLSVPTTSLSHSQSLALSSVSSSTCDTLGVMSVDADDKLGDTDSAAVARQSDRPAEVTQNCELSQLICDKSSNKEVVTMVTERKSDVTDTDLVCSLSDIETLPDALAVDSSRSCMERHTSDKHSASDSTVTGTSDTVVSTAAATDLVECDSKPVDKAVYNVDKQAPAYSQCEQLVTDHQTCSHSQHLIRLTPDRTGDCLLPSTISPCQDEFALPVDAARTAVKNVTAASDANNTDHITVIDKTTASSDEELMFEMTADNIERNATRQPERRSFDSDSAEMKRLETQCYSGLRTAELMYWRQADGSDRLLSGCNEMDLRCAVVDQPVADSVAEQNVPHIEPKPQRRKVHSCREKHVSSLMASVLAGKEWMSESEYTSWLAENKRDSEDLSCSDADQCENDGEQRLASANFQSVSTQIEPGDFVTLMNVRHDSEVGDMRDYIAVVDTSPRDISPHVTDSQMSPDVPFQLSLHKSCSTADETENMDSCSQLSFLMSCFPTISREDLAELLANCGNDVVVVADLLLEFGYEYNEPQDDVTDTSSSSTSYTNSASCSPDRSVVGSSSSSTEVMRSRKNSSVLYRLYRDSLVSKGIALDSTAMRREIQIPADVTSSSCTNKWDKSECTPFVGSVTSGLPLVVDSQPLTLSLTAVMASQLVQMFGPSGTDENLTVELDVETARCLHRCWQRTHHHQTVSASKQHSVGTSSSSSAAAAAAAAVTSIWSHGSYAQQFADDAAAHLLATKIKRQRLRDSHPGINGTVLDEMFRDNGYSLERTMQQIALNTELTRPAANVMTRDAAVEYEMKLLNQAIEQSLHDQTVNMETSLQPSLSEIDVTYEETLSRVIHHHRRHKECLSQAASAHSKGLWGAAVHYSHQARQHKKRHDDAKLLAAELFVQQRLATHDSDCSQLDLHGLSTAEAVHVLRSTLSKHEAEMSGKSRESELLVVTGRGRHSHNGVARLRPAVIAFLTANHYQYSEPTLGVLRVRLTDHR